MLLKAPHSNQKATLTDGRDALVQGEPSAKPSVSPLLYIQDIITDLSADCESLTLEDVLENGLVHKVRATISGTVLNRAILYICKLA